MTVPAILIRDRRTREAALQAIMRLDLNGKPWEVRIKRAKSSRSLRQNRLYRKWIDIIAKETGHSHDAVHNLMKQEFLPPRVEEVKGRVTTWVPSETELSVADMQAYMDAVHAWAAGFGIGLPVPEEMHLKEVA